MPQRREVYYEPHRRAVIVEDDDTAFYSIDTYIPLARPLGGEECLDSGIGARLCYKSIGEGCELVIIETNEGRRELVNIRYTGSKGLDPRGILRDCLRRAGLEWRENSAPS